MLAFGTTRSLRSRVAKVMIACSARSSPTCSANYIQRASSDTASNAGGTDLPPDLGFGIWDFDVFWFAVKPSHRSAAAETGTRASAIRRGRSNRSPGADQSTADDRAVVPVRALRLSALPPDVLPALRPGVCPSVAQTRTRSRVDFDNRRTRP
jgi:hypothetical protein